jgi:hypothetical protein
VLNEREARGFILTILIIHSSLLNYDLDESSLESKIEDVYLKCKDEIKIAKQELAEWMEFYVD